MNDKLLKLYYCLPTSLRSVAASLRGFYLRSWRYGPETERLMQEALERETWSTERWKAWQEERSAYVLHRAATQVPFYRNYWIQQRQRGNRASWEVLENWPILKKEVLRENPLAFVADDCIVRRMYCDRTSGTTGTPLTVYLNKDTMRKYYALYEARIRRWHGVSIRERWSMLGGQQVVPLHQEKPPFWVFNAGLHQLYLSTYHISTSNVKYYIDALYRYAPTHMMVYPSSAFSLSRIILDKALKVPKMKVIFSNAELLLDRHRKFISEAFKCNVRNTYGIAEMVTAASECERGTMHIWPEIGMIEVLDDMLDMPVKNGEVGRLILTGLLNVDMPLIRYEVGDRGSLELSEKKCDCTRSLPLLNKIEGRLNDMILTTDGRRVFWLNPVFYNLPVREAQIIQETLECIRVRYVPAPDFKPEVGRLIFDRLRERIGAVQVFLEQVDKIPREANGKFRAVISHIANEDIK